MDLERQGVRLPAETAEMGTDCREDVAGGPPPMADAETTTHDSVRFADCETQTGEWRRDLRELAALASEIDSAWEAVPLEPDFFVLMPMVDGHVVATVGAPLHFDQYRDLNPPPSE